MTKVMVVDDDEDFTNLYKSILKGLGFDTTTVNRSYAALEMAYLIKPDVFVIDLMMPDMNGFQLCRKLHADPVLGRTPIIVVTALTDEDNKRMAADAGANDYLSKPFHVDELNSRINALLK